MNIKSIALENRSLPPYTKARRERRWHYEDYQYFTLWRYVNDTVFRHDYYCQDIPKDQYNYDHPLPLSKEAWVPAFYEDAQSSECLKHDTHD